MHFYRRVTHVANCLHCLLSRKRDICTVDKLRDARQYHVGYCIIPEGARYSNTFLVCMHRSSSAAVACLYISLILYHLLALLTFLIVLE